MKTIGLTLIILIWLLPNTVIANSYLDSLETRLQLVSAKDQPDVLNKLARIYIDVDTKKSLMYSERSIELCKQYINISEQVIALNNLGLAYTKSKQVIKANAPFDQAIKIATKNKLTQLQAYSWHNLGKVYFSRKWTAEAKACFEEAQALFGKDAMINSLTSNSIGEQRLLLKDYDQALVHFRNAFKLALASGDLEQKYVSAQNLVAVYNLLGLTTDASEISALVNAMKELTPDEEKREAEVIVPMKDKKEPEVEQVVNYATGKPIKKVEEKQQSGDAGFYLKVIYGLIALVVVLLYLMYLVRKRYLKILQSHSSKSDGDNQKLTDTNFLLREEIKKRYEVEKSIIQEKAFLDSLIDSIPDHISYKDSKGVYIGCNEAYAEFNKVTSDKLKGKTEKDLHDEIKAKVITDIESEIEKTGEQWREKVWDKREDGSKVLLDILKTPFFAPDKKILGVITISRDMTAIQKAEEEIVKLSHAVEQSPVSIVITNTGGDIEYVNPMFSEITGYSREDVMGKGTSILKSGKVADKVYETLWDTISSGNNWSGELLNKRKDGELYWDYTNISPIYDKNGTIRHYLATKEDITIRKKQEQEVLQAKITAENANRTKSEFLAKMSHEIRTPMHGIIGMADILLQSDLSDDHLEQTGIIKSSANNLMSIINDVFDYTKMETEEIELEIFPFTVGETVKEVAGYLMEKLKEKNLKLFTEMDPDIPRMLNGDQVRLRQILLNLTNNAIKFTNKGEIKIAVNVEDMTADRVLLEFKVKDTGIGISKVGLEKLFQSFSQVDDTNSREYGGTGLGLVIAKRLVEAMDGKISVESQTGKGSVFTFTAWLEIGEESLGASNNESCDNLRILVAHPDENAHARLNVHFRKLNCKPDIVKSAQEAFTQMHKFVGSPRMYDIIVVNNKLPDSDGELFANMLAGDKFMNATKMVLLVNNDDLVVNAAEYDKMGLFGVVKEAKEAVELKKHLLRASSIKSNKASGGAKSDKDKSKQTRTSDLKVLLVEDNLINQKVAGMNLSKMNYNFDVANNGKVAVELFKEHPYQIIIMDIQMPIMDGFEATNLIREYEVENGIKPSLIIALTANALRGDREKYLDAGMDEYLSKPFNPSELKRVLQEFDRLV